MGWSLATVWWVVTGVLVAVELATGSFYLLMSARPRRRSRRICGSA